MPVHIISDANGRCWWGCLGGSCGGFDYGCGIELMMMLMMMLVVAVVVI